jgi:hypothetical protein
MNTVEVNMSCLSSTNIAINDILTINLTRNVQLENIRVRDPSFGYITINGYDFIKKYHKGCTHYINVEYNSYLAKKLQLLPMSLGDICLRIGKLQKTVFANEFIKTQKLD